MARQVTGRPLAQALNARTKTAVDDARARGLQPRVLDVIASSDPGVASYVRSKEKSAAALGITVSTVEQHLTRVYRKLQVSRRSDLRPTLRAALISEFTPPEER